MAETKEDIYSAIFNVQQQAEYIKKDKDGQVGQGKFKYADFASTWDVVKQLLKDNNILVLASPSSTDEKGVNGQFFKQTLRHVPSGTEVTDYMMMVLQRNDPQALGAAITFYRRYMLTAKLGLVPDDDNDARERRLATQQQKLKIVGALRQTFVDENGEPKEWTPKQINDTIEDIIGKHPANIRESEADNVVKLIKAYKK